MTDDSETIALRATVIGGHRYADDSRRQRISNSLLDLPIITSPWCRAAGLPHPAEDQAQ
jgi:hypothetical protein